MTGRRLSLLALSGLAVVGIGAAVLSAVPHKKAKAKPAPAPAKTSPAPATDKGGSYDAYYLPMDVSADKILTDLTFYKSQGLTSIYVSLSERDLADPTKMTTIIDTGHKVGLRVYANPYIGGTFSGDEGASKQFFLAQHPGSDQVSRLGLSSGYTPSINDPEYRDYLKKQIAAFANYGFDGYEFDEPEAGSRGAIMDEQKVGVDYYPYDHFSQPLFKQQYGYDMPAFENHDTVAFRRASMLGFIGELVDYARQIQPNWTIALVLLPDMNDGDIAGTDNWKDYAGLKNLDVFLIDPYWYPEVERGWDWFLAQVNAFTTATRGSSVKPGIWVRGFGLTGDYQFISQTLRYSLDHGFPWVSVWVSDNLANKDPAAAWAAIKSVYATP